MRIDLSRPHPFAGERVGFAFGRVGGTSSGPVVLVHDYEALRDDDYVDDGVAGATYGSDAIRRIRQRVLDRAEAAFHVHAHEHSGRPWFSRIDRSSLQEVVGAFRSLRPELPHGAVLLSDDDAVALAWFGDARPKAATLAVVGYPMRITR